MRYRAHRFNGEPPCRFEVKAMPAKAKHKAKKKQRRSILPWIDKLAAAFFWFVKTILLILEWWLSR